MKVTALPFGAIHPLMSRFSVSRVIVLWQFPFQQFPFQQFPIEEDARSRR